MKYLLLPTQMGDKTFGILEFRSVCFFMWLVMPRRLATNEARFVRRMMDDPRCRACGYVEEILEHILWRCPAATLVWRQVGVSNEMRGPHEPLEVWVLKNLAKEANNSSEH